MLLPFSYPFIIRFNLKRTKTLLDAGSGNGRFMTEINWDKKYRVVGVDLFDAYIRQANATKLYYKILKQDIRKLNFKKNSFDAVLASQIVEHFTKTDALKVIKKMEECAKYTIIISTPNGHFRQEAYDGNDLQEHLSSWSPPDFRKLGYSVYGQGLKLIYGEEGLIHTFLGKFFPTRILIFTFSYLMSPFVYYFPQYGTYLIGVKRKKT